MWNLIILWIAFLDRKDIITRKWPFQIRLFRNSKKKTGVKNKVSEFSHFDLLHLTPGWDRQNTRVPLWFRYKKEKAWEINRNKKWQSVRKIQKFSTYSKANRQLQPLVKEKGEIRFELFRITSKALRKRNSNSDENLQWNLSSFGKFDFFSQNIWHLFFHLRRRSSLWRKSHIKYNILMR